MDTGSKAPIESKPWSPSSWRAFPIKQQPNYKDKEALSKATEELSFYPPLITANEVDKLCSQLGEVAKGKRFLLQGGDCAERFKDCNSLFIEKKLRILLQMSLVLTWGARIPTVRIGRMAGQFSKPRSSDFETVDGTEVYSFRGDNVNGFDPANREPDPSRLLQAYFHSAATLNYVRALLAGKFADLHDAKLWDLDFVKNAAHRSEYEDMVKRILDALDFIKVCGAGDDPAFSTVDFFTSHEGLHLPFEESMTTKVGDKWYNLGAHFLWIGDRTRQLDHAHVEYFRGIENPIGIKVGPSSKPEEIVELVKILWPEPAAKPGRITLITRMGASKVAESLAPIVKAVVAAGLPVVWQCDPMHGNTSTSKPSGLKTRDLDNILKEIRITFEVHQSLGTVLGGVHLELTGENVTECTGGPEMLTEEDLPERYTTYCDPRLNYAQSMEVAFLMATYLADKDGKNRIGSRPTTPSARMFDLSRK